MWAMQVAFRAKSREDRVIVTQRGHCLALGSRRHCG